MNSRVGRFVARKLRERYRRHKPAVARRTSFLVLEAGKRLNYVSGTSNWVRNISLARAGSRGVGTHGRGFPTTAPRRAGFGASTTRVRFQTG